MIATAIIVDFDFLNVLLCLRRSGTPKRSGFTKLRENHQYAVLKISTDTCAKRER